ncbi:hypothetical protein CRUP_013339 [Coryphaenoides rupestris]|nr:hypothetical protein CRUP_013339 [Coryphaenoides rupestris]
MEMVLLGSTVFCCYLRVDPCSRKPRPLPRATVDSLAALRCIMPGWKKNIPACLQTEHEGEWTWRERARDLSDRS